MHAISALLSLPKRPWYLQEHDTTVTVYVKPAHRLQTADPVF